MCIWGQITTFESWEFPSTMGSGNGMQAVRIMQQVILPDGPSHGIITGIS